MTNEYKYRGEWQQNTGTKPDLPNETMVEAVSDSLSHTTGGILEHDWRINEDTIHIGGFIIFYRIVSNEPITDAQKQEALEEQRRKDGWVVWSDRAECATRKNPQDKVKILFVNDEVACYETHDSLVFCLPSDGKWRDSKGCSFRDFNDFDLVPYVEEKPTMWNIKDKEHFFSVSAVGDVQFSVWSRSDSNVKRRRLGLCSRTREGAEAIRDRLIAEEEQRRKENE